MRLSTEVNRTRQLLRQGDLPMATWLALQKLVSPVADIDAANGKLTNYRWVAGRPILIPELRSNTVPKPGEVFVYALYTVPEYRRRRIDSFTRHYVYDLLYKTTGVTRVLATIFAGNYASFQASRQFLAEVGRVWYVSLHGRTTRLFMRPTTAMPTLVPASPDGPVHMYSSPFPRTKIWGRRKNCLRNFSSVPKFVPRQRSVFSGWRT
jgi:hypothetical protein